MRRIGIEMQYILTISIYFSRSGSWWYMSKNIFQLGWEIVIFCTEMRWKLFCDGCFKSETGKKSTILKAYRRYLFWENFHPIFLPMIWYYRWNSPSIYWNDLRLRRRRRLRSDVSSNVTILFMRNAAVKVKRNRKMLVSGL